MAEQEEQDQKAEKSGGGTPWLLVLLVGLLCLGLGAGGAWFVFGRGASAEPVAEAAEAAAVEVDPAEAFQARLFALEPFVVNVSGEGYPRYLKLRVEMLTDGPPAREELEARLAQVRDAVILLLSSKRLADIGDFEGKALLKDDLRERVNALLESGQIESVLFTEFVVQ